MSPEAVLRRLADGQTHSGQDLAEEMGVTRAAVWKQISKLKDWGLDVEATAGQGYRLKEPIDFLDGEAIASSVRQSTTMEISSIHVFTEQVSTNRYLLEQAPPEPGSLAICLAEFQSAGRGRRGRSWNAPLGGGLCLSVAWQFADVPRELPALTLAVGVAARQSIKATAGIDTALKWPNDLVFADRKLGGILVELKVEAHGACHVVAGLGINVSMPAEMLAQVSDWPGGAIDLNQATNGTPPSRTELAAQIISTVATVFASFESTGFAPYREEWRKADCLKGRLVQLEDGSGMAVGTARGIGLDGSLLFDTLDGDRRRIVSGDVSVRPSA